MVCETRGKALFFFLPRGQQGWVCVLETSLCFVSSRSFPPFLPLPTLLRLVGVERHIHTTRARTGGQESHAVGLCGRAGGGWRCCTAYRLATWGCPRGMGRRTRKESGAGGCLRCACRRCASFPVGSPAAVFAGVALQVEAGRGRGAGGCVGYIACLLAGRDMQDGYNYVSCLGVRWVR